VLEVPPLRARRDNIALLVEHFRGEVTETRDLGLDIKGVNREAMAILDGDDWPGNARELEAVVKRAMVRRRCGWVTPEDIVLPRLRWDRLPEAMRGLISVSLRYRSKPFTWPQAATRCGAEI
jgi:DNA-binding NtrC family response regulator